MKRQGKNRLESPEFSSFWLSEILQEDAEEYYFSDSLFAIQIIGETLV